MDLLLFGIQGSGKGTQAGFLYEKYKFKRFGTGHELRNIVRNEQSERARHIQKIMQEGRLISDHIIFDLLENYIEHNNTTDPIIFDGLPRNSAQLEMFDHIMTAAGRQYVAAFFDISLVEALSRIKSRKECASCGHPQVLLEGALPQCEKCGGVLSMRSDDESEQVIMSRFQNFYLSTFPVISSLYTSGKLSIINAAYEPRAVFAQLDLILQQYHFKKNETTLS